MNNCPRCELIQGLHFSCPDEKPVWDASASLVMTPNPAFAKRKWVGLTDEERRDIREWQMIQEELGPVWASTLFYFYLAIEAKLKEKNT